MRLAIRIGSLVVHAELAQTPTAAALEADCRQVVPELASPCNVLGTLIGDAKALARVRPGEKIRVSLA